MTPTVPIPTDSIYKFYALCGLAFFIAALLGLVYLHDRFNERGGNIYLELQVLNKKENPSEDERIKRDFLNEKYRVHRADRKFFIYGLSVVAGLGLGGMIFGFYFWQTKVQPDHDKLLQLQIQKLQREILKLDQELAKTPRAPVDAEARGEPERLNV